MASGCATLRCLPSKMQEGSDMVAVECSLHFFVFKRRNKSNAVT